MIGPAVDGAGPPAIPIVIRCGGVFLTAQLDDCDTTRKIAAVLPITSEAGRWGEEVYFEIPVAAHLAPDARDVMQPGEIAYWPPGKALCVFWGKTPSSRGEEVRAASPVNPIGRVTGDVFALAGVRDGDEILVERV